MTDWKPGDLCQVRRGKKWVDAVVHDECFGRPKRLMVDGKLRWLGNDPIRTRPAKRGKLPEPPIDMADAMASAIVEEARWNRIAEEQRKAALKPVPKPTTARDGSYLDHVRSKPCCSCGAPPRSHAHHVAGGGMGAKCSDYLTAPLCATCHSWWHAKAELPSMASPHPLGVDAAKAVMWEFAARCLEEWVRR